MSDSTLDDRIETYAWAVERTQGASKKLTLLRDIQAERALHDFGWALRQMRAGLIGLLDGVQYRLLELNYGPDLMMWDVNEQGYGQWTCWKPSISQLLRTDWDICADSEGVE